MSSGLPIVSTPVGFIKDYIKDNVNGFIFPLKDDFSLYKKLELIKNNSSLAKTVGNRARATVIRKFKWNDTVDGIKSALNSIEY
jgi:glycosyltransferase involved in cell wall biosynthesis